MPQQVKQEMFVSFGFHSESPPKRDSILMHLLNAKCVPNSRSRKSPKSRSQIDGRSVAVATVEKEFTFNFQQCRVLGAAAEETADAEART
jgi:hypothetical protein